MPKWLKYSLLPVTAAFAALFAVLPPSAPGTKVSMKAAGEGRYRYIPDTIRVEPGAAITFFNESRATHTATCPDCGFDTGDLLSGLLETVRVTREPGTYQFFCRYHRSEGLTGTIVVAPPGAAAPPS